ncbi:Hypothetical_protein [Hexamita inflata]|uniref:Hypothetical_protein n=1 Tax=Hexamita inflata TaxID=28002 RepID=A0AA86Q9U0_9EUKA|nr:Hypothetical protein HINF_LOCUS40811 [Hexamita inflata]
MQALMLQQLEKIGRTTGVDRKSELITISSVIWNVPGYTRSLINSAPSAAYLALYQEEIASATFLLHFSQTQANNAHQTSGRTLFQLESITCSHASESRSPNCSIPASYSWECAPITQALVFGIQCLKESAKAYLVRRVPSQRSLRCSCWLAAAWELYNSKIMTGRFVVNYKRMKLINKITRRVSSAF